MRKWYPAVLAAVTFAAAFLVYPRLPDRVPTHWDLHDRVNGYGPRWMVTFLFPVMLLVLWGILRFLPRIDPRRANYAKMQSTYDLVVNLTLTLIAVLHFVVLGAAMGAPISIARIVPAIVGAALVAIGNVLPRARPNWWFGIRTPWTLSNDRVWERTHRIGGYVLMAVGALAILASIAGVTIASAAVGVAAAALGLGLIVYSYLAWRQETSR
jgi:uncharacterized membrane protein